MPFSKKSIRLAKWIYWIVGLFVHLWLCYTLFTMNRAITAIIWLILGLVLLSVMYIYYFSSADSSSTWPPYITVCPDYLTSVTQKNNAGTEVMGCFDLVGLNNPHINKSDPNNLTPPDNTSYSRFAFDPSGTVNQKITNARVKGLTWQGLF